MKRYPYARRAAMAVLCVVVAFASACGPKKVSAPTGPQVRKARPVAPAAKHAPVSPAVNALMRQAFVEGRTHEALAGLNRLIEAGRPPDLQEALFRRIQLLLYLGDERAVPEAKALLKAYPDYPLVPYLHFWLMRQAESRQQNDAALAHALAVFTDKHASDALKEKTALLGAAAARRSADWEAVQWFLEAARDYPGKRDAWLREAAARASMAMLGRLRDAGRLNDDEGRDLLLNAARSRLLNGDMAAVGMISDWLQQDFPRSGAARISRSWAVGVTHAADIGVMLPLTGAYAKFGRQALNGIRLAVSGLQEQRRITLHVADSASGLTPQADERARRDACLAAYHKLLEAHVSIILGPLLGGCAEAVAQHAEGDAPMISLSSRAQAARASGRLFVHTLSSALQARYMADYAVHEGDARAVVIAGNSPTAAAEADAFAREFTQQGGEIVQRLVLPEASIDFRRALHRLRMQTDDAVLLAELDEDLALSAQDADEMEIRMPVNFDAAYLALPGRQVALLAGQLAYVGINHVHLYGSSRWQDGFLLSDKGRYLHMARFSDVAFPNGKSPELRRFKLAWRDVWGLEEPSKLAGLAYDSTRIAVLLTHRMGLTGDALLTALRDKAGFPGLTGHVRFSMDGMGRKDFQLFRIRKGRIVPAG